MSEGFFTKPDDMGEAVSKEELDAKLNKDFEAWHKSFAHRLVGIPQANAYEVRNYELVCNHKADNKTCGSLIQYQLYEGKLRAVDPAGDVLGGLGGFASVMSQVVSPLLHKRIKPYLHKNGFVSCDKCGAIYRAVVPNDGSDHG